VVVIGGGMTRSYPGIVAGVRARAGIAVQPSRAGGLKSAASVALFGQAIRTLRDGS
jgi:hypothetical protein